MPYIKCQLCGSGGVQSLNINICTRCIKLGGDNTKILAIKKYIEKYPDAKVKEVSKALGISQEVIDRFIKEGSLILIENDGETITAEELQKKEIQDAKEKRKKLARELSDMKNYSKQRYSEERRSQLLIDLDEIKESGRQRGRQR